MTVTLKEELKKILHEGIVIPAHPLALTGNRQLDEEKQRALTNYYLSSGAGGAAVGVHTTQFEIREAGLYERVLALAAEEIKNRESGRPFIKIAGICGPASQAAKEAETAVKLGYDLGLLSLGGLNEKTEEELLFHVKEIASILPVFGFYLQPSVGGRILSYSFWREFAEIPNVMAVKMAPFNRYQTLDVARAVCESSRRDEIALYTGNDDSIVFDLLTTFQFIVNGRPVRKTISGGLLGQWAVWTGKAVQLLEKIKKYKQNQDRFPSELTELAWQLTDANAAIFDAANSFKGCIPGIHEVLRLQGLLDGIWCLDLEETLSPGQKEEIRRIMAAYPHLADEVQKREQAEAD
ncbi:dihydrodipicolinate synthase family protein [Metabacillus sp. GX 13764]|uniref:dihydrodipicolinate synthase family protein n=1 Tax=Metabacillus kandeliae TaxID=2900151 RepID=UPI001E4D0FA7|nr:dihydrodipicolinate synthase family protein [Metabacillus kandeliae]MCD7032975.1 dihydrodipicolinate synthase family protein [Metabacillus kandeliae]